MQSELNKFSAIMNRWRKSKFSKSAIVARFEKRGPGERWLTFVEGMASAEQPSIIGEAITVARGPQASSGERSFRRKELQ